MRSSLRPTSSARRRRSSGGFTFPELSVGIVVTMIIMGALAGITYAVSKGWTNNDGTQSLQLQATQVAARIQKSLSAAKFIGTWQAGFPAGASSGKPASIFFWRADDFPNGSPDLTIQTAEMSLIIYDVPTRSIFLYQPIPYSQMTATQLTQGATTMSNANITNAITPAIFRTLNYMATRKALAGPGDHALPGTHTLVSAMQCNVRDLDNSAALPSVEFSFTLTRGTDSVTQYGTATLRSPTTRPN